MRTIAVLLASLALSGCAEFGAMPWESESDCIRRQRVGGQTDRDAASICAPLLDAQGNRLAGARAL